MVTAIYELEIKWVSDLSVTNLLPQFSRVCMTYTDDNAWQHPAKESSGKYGSIKLFFSSFDSPLVLFMTSFGLHMVLLFTSMPVMPSIWHLASSFVAGKLLPSHKYVTKGDSFPLLFTSVEEESNLSIWIYNKCIAIGALCGFGCYCLFVASP